MCLHAICVSMQAIAIHQRTGILVQARLHHCTLAPSENRREAAHLSHEFSIIRIIVASSLE